MMHGRSSFITADYDLIGIFWCKLHYKLRSKQSIFTEIGNINGGVDGHRIDDLDLSFGTTTTYSAKLHTILTKQWFVVLKLNII